MIRLNKEDLSVDNVHTPFGLTKLSSVKPLDSINEPKPRILPQDLEVMLRSVPLRMKRCRSTTTYRTQQERKAWPQFRASVGPTSRDPEPAPHNFTGDPRRQASPAASVRGT